MFIKILALVYFYRLVYVYFSNFAVQRQGETSKYPVKQQKSTDFCVIYIPEINIVPLNNIPYIRVVPATDGIFISILTC